MTNLEARQHLARKLDLDYNDLANNDQFNDTDLQVFVQLGVSKAWDFKPWPFTQKAKTATTNNSGVTLGYYDHPSDVVQGSVFLLKVGGKEYKKLEFQDYLKYLEDDPTGKNRYWSEWASYIYINANAYSVGNTYDLYGKGFPITLSGSSDLLPFSPSTDNNEYSGNEAIVLFAYAEALASEKKKEYTQAETERKKAYAILDVLWQPFADRKALMQSAGRPMFNVPDFMGNGRNANDYIGNFNYLN